jgi:antitoxin component YwqK of YwqJK toxin-antitoxin module
MKRFLPIFLAALFVLMTSCKEKLIPETLETWPDGKPKKVAFYQKVGDKKEKVKEILYYQDGKKQMEGEFRNGKKDGKWTAWFENGRMQSEGFFKNDLRDGKSIVWRENGFKYYEGNYSLGQLHGSWIMYDTDGKPLKEALFEHDRKVKEVNFSDRMGN